MVDREGKRVPSVILFIVDWSWKSLATMKAGSRGGGGVGGGMRLALRNHPELYSC